MLLEPLEHISFLGAWQGAYSVPGTMYEHLSYAYPFYHFGRYLKA